MSEPTGTQYGGFWVRFLALLADSAIVFLISTVLVVGAAMVLGSEDLTPVIFAIWLLSLLYWPVMHASGGQATFGKAIVGLKVARFDGRRISILRSLWRELAKIFSAAVLMLGYLMAAFLPRKQGLHDLMAATYVVREGPSRVIAAFAIAIAGFALPVFVGPMVVDAGLISRMTRMAEEMVPRQDLLKMVSEHDLMRMISQHDLMKLVSREDAGKKPAARPATPAPKAPPKPQAPAPVPVAKAPAPKPEPVALAQPAPAAVVEPVKPAPEPAKPVAVAKPEKPKSEPAKPKAERTAKPKPAAQKAVARASKPAGVPPSTSKTGSGPRYNDLMTAVMYRDTEGVNELLKLGKWADKPDSRGTTPLMVAAELGDVRTAEALLRAGANARPAMPVAEERRHGEMILLLKRYSGR